MFNDFWTYEGSMTSPPCREGIQWWGARNTLFVGVEQMQRILGVGTYSARVEQEVWMHGINVYTEEVKRRNEVYARGERS
jgi:carbonic anhydrase